VAALAALEQGASQHPWSADLVRAEVEREPPDGVLVLETPEGIVAYGAWRVVVDELHVTNLAVRPDRRRQGLGRFLLGAMLRRAANAGARRALLEVRASNRAARALYAQSGFVLIGERKAYYSDPPDDALVLAREAPAPAGSDRS
jgi:ribosomal-protein-alanine N-acetyltransferase